MKLIKHLIVCSFFLCSYAYGQESNHENSKEADKNSTVAEQKTNDTDNTEKEEPPKIGNFVLPVSQQPAALVGFGGNIINKDEVQISLSADAYRGSERLISDVYPSLLFGVTSNFSILFSFPFTPLMEDGRHRSSGFEDFFVQLEYAFYNKSTTTYADQATIVASVIFPTGSSKKIPPTGFGSPSLFLGATYYHTLVDWFLFTAPGAILTSSNHGTKFGDQFLYQFGIGRNIPSPRGWIYAWMVEVDGLYARKNRIDGDLDKNSGGNVIYVTPSLWLSSKEFLVQFGVSFPVNQNLFGRQHKIDYAVSLNFSWSFY